jgi:hypothetical protein
MRWNCMNWTSRSQRSAMSAAFEQGLLRADVERRDLGDAVDQHLVVEPGHRFPIDRIAERIGVTPRFALELGALDARERLGLARSLYPALTASTWRVGRCRPAPLRRCGSGPIPSRTMLNRPSSRASDPQIRPMQPISNKAG